MVPEMLLSKVRERDEGLKKGGLWRSQRHSNLHSPPAFCPVFPAKGKLLGFLLL